MEVDIGLLWDFKEGGRRGEFDVSLMEWCSEYDSTVTLADSAGAENGGTTLRANCPEGSLVISRDFRNLT